VILGGLFDPLMDAADGALCRVLDAGTARRERALDLLAADAFVTWAFEAASDDPATISQRAEEAMKRISTRAKPYLDRETP
jgi:hypothetical protein